MALLRQLRLGEYTALHVLLRLASFFSFFGALFSGYLAEGAWGAPLLSPERRGVPQKKPRPPSLPGSISFSDSFYMLISAAFGSIMDAVISPHLKGKQA